MEKDTKQSGNQLPLLPTSELPGSCAPGLRRNSHWLCPLPASPAACSPYPERKGDDTQGIWSFPGDKSSCWALPWIFSEALGHPHKRPTPRGCCQPHGAQRGHRTNRCTGCGAQKHDGLTPSTLSSPLVSAHLPLLTLLQTTRLTFSALPPKCIPPNLLIILCSLI